MRLPAATTHRRRVAHPPGVLLGALGNNCACVGTILALINHGQEILAGAFSARWVIPMVVTYLVPFSVAT